MSSTLMMMLNSASETVVEPSTATLSVSTDELHIYNTTSLTITVTLASGALYNGNLTLSYGSKLSGDTTVTCTDGSATVDVTCSAYASSFTITVSVPESDIAYATSEKFTFDPDSYYNSSSTYWIVGASKIASDGTVTFSYRKCYYNGALVVDRNTSGTFKMNTPCTIGVMSGTDYNYYWMGSQVGKVSAPSDGSSSLTYYHYTVCTD